MPINKQAVEEILIRDGEFSALEYLCEHENLEMQYAQAYLNANYNLLIDNIRLSQNKPIIKTQHSQAAEYYHECCNIVDLLDDSEHKCNTTIWHKVKSLFT